MWNVNSRKTALMAALKALKECSKGSRKLSKRTLAPDLDQTKDSAMKQQEILQFTLDELVQNMAED